MNDDIWQEEVLKERCSSPSIEDEDMDEDGGQPEAVDEDKQPAGGAVEHEAMQETSGAEESQLLLTAVSPTAAPAIPTRLQSPSRSFALYAAARPGAAQEGMEADPGGTHEVATPHSAAAAVLVPATDEVAAQEPEEPEDLWGDREGGRGAEKSLLQAEVGAGGEAAEHEAKGAEAAAEEGSEPAGGEAEPAEEAAAEKAAAEVHVALGGGCSSEDEDEDEVSDDDEPCTVSYPTPSPRPRSAIVCPRTDSRAPRLSRLAGRAARRRQEGQGQGQGGATHQAAPGARRRQGGREAGPRQEQRQGHQAAQHGLPALLLREARRGRRAAARWRRQRGDEAAQRDVEGGDLGSSHPRPHPIP